MHRAPGCPADDLVQQGQLDLTVALPAEFRTRGDRPTGPGRGPAASAARRSARCTGLIGRSNALSRQRASSGSTSSRMNCSAQSSFAWNSGSVSNSHMRSLLSPSTGRHRHTGPSTIYYLCMMPDASDPLSRSAAAGRRRPQCLLLDGGAGTVRLRFQQLPAAAGHWCTRLEPVCCYCHSEDLGRRRRQRDRHRGRPHRQPPAVGPRLPAAVRRRLGRRRRGPPSPGHHQPGRYRTATTRRSACAVRVRFEPVERRLAAGLRARPR